MDLSDRELSITYRLGFKLFPEGDTPYIVSMCFGYDGANLYFHSAGEGRKIEILKKNNAVCFEFDILAEALIGKKPCDSFMRYMSVMGEGRATFVEDAAEKLHALRAVMRQYGDDEGLVEEKSVSGIVLIKVAITGISGKKSRM